MANNNKHTGPNVPALRFPEFSGEWERKALSEFVDRVTRRNKGLKSTRPLTISAQFGLVDQTEFFKKSVAGADLSNYYLLSKGEFAYNKSYSDGYPLGAIKRLDRYDSGVLSSLYICFVPKPYMSSDYLVQYFESTKWNQVVKDISGEGARNHGLLNVPVTGFFETQHYIPKRDEQEKLGAFLTLIEKRIATQSKIIEELKTLRGALVDTYINDGNNNENQTIMSLGAYGCFVRGLTYSSVDVTDNTATTGVVRSNNLEYGSPVDIKADLVYVTKKPSPEQMLVNGDIVICMANGSSSLVGKASNYQELCRNMTVGAFCGIYRGTHPLTKWIFMSSAYCKAVANAIQGGNGAIANLHAEDILSMCFAVPSDYKTITELGKLLSLFDEKLHAAEEQLVRFIEQKKYFLFKMFI